MDVLYVDARSERRSPLGQELTEVGHRIIKADSSSAVLANPGILAQVGAVLIGAVPAGEEAENLVAVLREVLRRHPDAQFASLPLQDGETEVAEATSLENESAAKVHAWLVEIGMAPGVASASQVPAAGSALGDYQLDEVMAESERLVTYRATQQSVSRSVVLQLLRPQFRGTEAGVAEFQDLVKAQARLVHRNVAPVFEVAEADDQLFYTAEIIRGHDLEELAVAGRRLTDEQAVEIVRVASLVMGYLREKGIAHRPLRATDVHFERAGQVMLANIAVTPGSREANETRGARDIRTLAEGLRGLVGDGEAANLLDEIRGEGEDLGITSWDKVAEACAVSSNHLKAARTTGRVSSASQWMGSKSSKRLGIGLASLLGVGLALGAVLWHASNRPPAVRVFDEVRTVRAGSIVLPGDNGAVTEVGKFWIDAHETTLAEYAEFLAEIETSDSAAYDHPAQPAEKADHRPADWDALLTAAQKGAKWGGAPIDLNHPVASIDWWDAYAYANWRGGRLPSFAEWGFAASSNYPWGDTLDDTRTNRAGADAHPRTAPVDGFPDDLTDLEIAGLVGNVEEWTSTTRAHPTFPDLQIPVVAGGSYQSDADVPVLHAQISEQGERHPHRGLRVAYDARP